MTTYPSGIGAYLTRDEYELLGKLEYDNPPILTEDQSSGSARLVTLKLAERDPTNRMRVRRTLEGERRWKHYNGDAK